MSDLSTLEAVKHVADVIVPIAFLAPIVLAAISLFCKSRSIGDERMEADHRRARAIKFLLLLPFVLLAIVAWDLTFKSMYGQARNRQLLEETRSREALKAPLQRARPRESEARKELL